jgi:HEAT repeat protein
LVVALLFACSERGEVEDLLSRLERGTSAERLAALEALSRRPKALELPRLRLLLEDPSPAIRALALSIAAARAEPQIVDWVGQRVDDPDPEVRRAALDALRRFESPAREPYLMAAYPLHGLEGRSAIVAEFQDRDERLLRLIEGEARAIWERNVSALQSGGVAELVGALELVGRSGREEAVDRLIALLDGESTRVVVAAARALSLSGGGTKVREALEALLASEIPARRAAAIEALERLGDRGAIPALRLAAERPGDEAVAAARAPLAFEIPGPEACDTAGAAHDLRARRLLARHARAKGSTCTPEDGPESPEGQGEETVAAEASEGLPSVRPAALRVEAAKDPEKLHALAAQDPSWEVRLAAVEALARDGRAESADRLLALAKGEDEIGKLAIEALERRRDANRLLQVLRSTSSPHAAEALARMGRAEAGRALLEPDAAGRVTPEWLLSLGAVDAAVATEAARRHLAHDRPEIRAAAARVLAPRCDLAAMPLLRALAAADYYVEVRTAAREAVEAIRKCRP